MKKIIFSLMTLVLGLSTMNAQDVLGKWKLEDGTAIVEVYKQGEVFNGKIVWLKTPTEADGSTVTVNAKAVILATGGYAQNREMMARIPGDAGYYSSVPTSNTGDCLVMAEAVGAQIWDSPSAAPVFINFTCGAGGGEQGDRRGGARQRPGQAPGAGCKGSIPPDRRHCRPQNKVRAGDGRRPHRRIRHAGEAA